MYQNYVPVHSDYIIHWTGKDIDSEFDSNWSNNNSSTTNLDSAEKYIQRLKSILKYGLWMTENIDDESIKSRYTVIKPPIHSRTCFTELKLSMARSHAAEFGRLGIGFKRFFLFNRLGAPMIYYNFHGHNWLFPPLLNTSEDDFYKCFFKPMAIKTEDTTLRFKYFDESEWRIIYSSAIKKKLDERGLQTINSQFTSYEDINDQEFTNYCSNCKIKPKFLIPIKDPWLAMIIYPSLEVKVRAQSDNEIKKLIEANKRQFNSEIKTNPTIKNPAQFEPFNYPIEIDLDACRNF
jgi:hypothetical protein